MVSAKGRHIMDQMVGALLEMRSPGCGGNVGYGRRALAEAAGRRHARPPRAHHDQPGARHLPRERTSPLGTDSHVDFECSGIEQRSCLPDGEASTTAGRRRGEGRCFKIISRYRAYHGNNDGAMGAYSGRPSARLGHELGRCTDPSTKPPYPYRRYSS